MLKVENKSQTKVKYFTLKLRVSFYVTTKDLEHKFLQVLIFIKQSAIEINMGRNKFKYNTNYNKGLKKN